VLSVKVAGSQGDSTAEFTFDVKAGTMIRGSRNVIPGPKTIEVDIVVPEFVEVQPGIYFPKLVTSTTKYGGEVAKLETMSFANLQVNVPPPAGTFDLIFPPGTKVTDELQGTEYTVNAEGNAGGSEALKLPGLPLSPKGEPVSPRTETREEPASWYWALLPVSIVLLVATIVARVVRRRRAERS
jgi:hypothetical protein